MGTKKWERRLVLGARAQVRGAPRGFGARPGLLRSARIGRLGRPPCPPRRLVVVRDQRLVKSYVSVGLAIPPVPSGPGRRTTDRSDRNAEHNMSGRKRTDGKQAECRIELSETAWAFLRSALATSFPLRRRPGRLVSSAPFKRRPASFARLREATFPFPRIVLWTGRRRRSTLT